MYKDNYTRSNEDILIPAFMIDYIIIITATLPCKRSRLDINQSKLISPTSPFKEELKCEQTI